MHSVICKWAMLLMHTVNDAGDPASRINHLDIRFDERPKLLRDCFGSHTQGKRLAGVQIQEDAIESGSKHHIHFLLRVQAMRMLVRLQREREDVGGEMYIRKITHASNVSITFPTLHICGPSAGVPTPV